MRAQAKTTSSFCDHGIEITRRLCPVCHYKDAKKLSAAERAVLRKVLKQQVREGFVSQEQADTLKL